MPDVPTSPTAKPSTDDVPSPNDSARGAVSTGLAILLLFFGGFGAWAVTAPLNSAVIGNAVVKVEGNRKSVQHLDGGIVEELRVSEGDQVDKGDVLLVLDDTDVRAEVQVLTEQETLLLAIEARLQAELQGADEITFPTALTERSDEPSVSETMADQVEEFRVRRAALQGRESVLERRIAQLDEEIAGNRGERAALREQLDSVVNEKTSIQDLLDEELIPRARMLQLDRAESGIRGQIATVNADIAAAREAISELDNEITQLTKDRTAEITSRLSDTRAKLLDLAPRLQSARAALDRTTVVAPYAGTVVDLNVFSVGGVIARGERILDIVPDATAMVVEAQIAVEDIADLTPGMPAEVHFTSYKQRVTPLIHGTLTEISADRLTDERTGAAYYKALVAVDRDELAASPEIKLYPGMPATVMITTQERTALDYLVGPLTASFDHAFRER